jgi:hypothetical protein
MILAIGLLAVLMGVICYKAVRYIVHRRDAVRGRSWYPRKSKKPFW